MNMPQSPQARISQRGRPRNHGGGRGAGGQGGGNIGSGERDPSSIGPLTEVKLIAQLILCDADCSQILNLAYRRLFNINSHTGILASPVG